jgi:hypothetical protein
MLSLNRSAIVVIPKQPFLDWLHAADPTTPGQGKPLKQSEATFDERHDWERS